MSESPAAEAVMISQQALGKCAFLEQEIRDLQVRTDDLQQRVDDLDRHADQLKGDSDE